MKLSSNRDLYEYLVRLASELEGRLEALSRALAAAARTRSVSPATEFLGESRIVLRRVLAEENGILSQIERETLQDMLREVDATFDRR
jgi:hypothetical protein